MLRHRCRWIGHRGDTEPAQLRRPSASADRAGTVVDPGRILEGLPAPAREGVGEEPDRSRQPGTLRTSHARTSLLHWYAGSRGGTRTKADAASHLQGDYGARRVWSKTPKGHRLRGHR